MKNCETCFVPAACVRGNGQRLICVDCDRREHEDFELQLRLEGSFERLKDDEDAVEQITARIMRLDTHWQTL